MLLSVLEIVCYCLVVGVITHYLDLVRLDRTKLSHSGFILWTMEEFRCRCIRNHVCGAFKQIDAEAPWRLLGISVAENCDTCKFALMAAWGQWEDGRRCCH
mmetsp:Transcript_89880/g.141936  ORF Transcript_89880/g.141936 Transcript_89880/m.141936 type:complete len:101 (-) Transcript_89880:171-473(-)